MNLPASQPLLSRMAPCIKQKLLLLIILPLFLDLCYFLPQWVPIYTSRQIPLTAIDQAIPFQPWWILPYLSMYLLLPLVPLFATTLPQLRRYAAGTALMFMIAAICFFLWPISYPRPLPLDTNPVIYRLITSIDKPINSLPSLHAGLTVFTLCFAHRIFKDLPTTQRRLLLTICWLWAALILYGTLATKQHYLADLPPGALLAWISDFIVWRKKTKTPELTEA